MEGSTPQSPMSTTGCARAFSEVGSEADNLKVVNKRDQLRAARSNNDSPSNNSFLSPGSSSSDNLEGLPLLPSRLNSPGDDTFSTIGEDGPELNVESIHKFIGSPRYHMEGGVPRPKILAHISGTGLAPWEIHRPQKFVRELVLRRCFSGGGRVLDAGCGIGDNALYVAKAAPGAEVTAVDVVPRCLEFAAAKAGLRNMRGTVELLVGDLLEADPTRLPPALGPDASGCFTFVLDSLTFHCFSDADRERYVASLRRLLRPGGRVFMNCMSEEETRPGGPRRVTVPELLAVFSSDSGWEVEGIEDSVIEFHPAFWGGRAKARLYTIRKL